MRFIIKKTQMEKTKKLNVHLSIGIKFITIVLLTFAIFAAITRVIQNYYTITIDNNITFLTKWIVLYIIVQLIVLLVAFSKNLKEIKINIRLVVLLGLLFMLITTVLSMKLSIYVTVVFGVSAIVYGLFINKYFKPHPLFYFIFAYFVFQIIGLAWSEDSQYGLKIIERELSYLLVPVAFSFFIVTVNERTFLLKLFFRLLLIYMFAIIIAYIYQINFHHLNYLAGLSFNKRYIISLLPDCPHHKLYLSWAGYSHPTFVCFILNLILGLGIYLRKKDTAPNKITITEIVIFGLLTVLTLFILQSRLGMISLPVVGVLVLYNFFYKKRILTSILTFFIATVSAAIALFVFLPHKEFFNDPIRMYQFNVMTDYIKEHYLLGTGTGGMIKYIPMFPTANNQIIGDLFQLGIGGLWMVILLCGSVLYYSIKDRNYMLFFFFALYFLLMQTEMPLQLQKGITFFTLFTGLFVRPVVKTE